MSANDLQQSLPDPTGLREWLALSSDRVLSQELSALPDGPLWRLISAGALARHEITESRDPVRRQTFLAALLSGEPGPSGPGKTWARGLEEAELKAIDVVCGAHLEAMGGRLGTAHADGWPALCVAREDIESVRALLAAHRLEWPHDAVARRVDARASRLLSAWPRRAPMSASVPSERMARALAQYPEAWWTAPWQGAMGE